MVRGVAAILFSLLLLFSTSSALSPTGQVLKNVHWIMEQVQRIRGLDFKERPKVIVITREDALLLFAPTRVTEEIRLREELYKMTLLLPPDVELFRKERDRKAGWIAATVGDRIYVIRENFLSSGSIALRATAHELVHVLQREWFDAKYVGNTLDETLALRALVEGDADIVADIFCRENGLEIVKITNISRDNSYWSLNVFPYVFGDRFVAFLYERGGWALVNSAYDRPPISTKVVMFPALYLEGWEPENVTLEVRGRVLLRERLGAYYVFLLAWRVENWGKAMELARTWMGDEAVLYEKEGRHALVWKVLFSSEKRAREFASVLKELAEGKDYARFSIRVEGSYAILEAEK
ncbi:hypothetical protein [Pyrococcus yayanosii]|uniref:DUF4157 domain-containing protein n=1 Tax=Pyrococcus yayanosii (strain CH1 / JCM 16557) TaxID=529709 RepID=F8AIG0_PYRYC|nr:hypothetical protein [Pyrococcus yayanosii]AEH25572.1 hypothetical protein PYCH_19170 [Pyrococcus yayanosii CH1]